jgi:hypothetical protein
MVKSEEGKLGNPNLPIGGFRASQETGEPGVRRSAKGNWTVSMCQWGKLRMNPSSLRGYAGHSRRNGEDGNYESP